MKMNNITLIGMPGAGKSTLGVVLAKILGYEFLDSDLLIQKEEKRRLYQIIDEEGEDGFKAIENRVNASIDTENTVIADSELLVKNGYICTDEQVISAFRFIACFCFPDFCKECFPVCPVERNDSPHSATL